MRHSTILLGLTLATAGGASANEVTLKNDSLTNFANAAIVWGFVSGERAASWLTSSCDGNLVAAQIFWRSQSGTEANVIGNAIYIYRSGTFPTPGSLAQTIGGPVLQDNVMNEWRYLDENNTLPLSVPVTNGETVVVAFEFADPPQPPGPSVVRDTDGNTSGRNAIYADLGGGSFTWFDSATLGVQGDWVIRAVVNCQAVGTNANVAVAMSSTPTAYTAGAPLQYTITVSNSGPAAATSTSISEFAFPASSFTGVTWTCATSGAASCPASGSGSINGTVSLPAGSQVVYTVDGTVAPGTTGTLSHSVNANVGAPATDPDTANNTATLDLSPAPNDVIFANGFDPSAGLLRVVSARAGGFAAPRR